MFNNSSLRTALLMNKKQQKLPEVRAEFLIRFQGKRNFNFVICLMKVINYEDFYRNIVPHNRLIKLIKTVTSCLLLRMAREIIDAIMNAVFFSLIFII